MISKLSWLLFSLLVICGAVQGSLRSMAYFTIFFSSANVENIYYMLARRYWWQRRYFPFPANIKFVFSNLCVMKTSLKMRWSIQKYNRCNLTSEQLGNVFLAYFEPYYIIKWNGSCEYSAVAFEISCIVCFKVVTCALDDVSIDWNVRTSQQYINRSKNNWQVKLTDPGERPKILSLCPLMALAHTNAKEMFQIIDYKGNLLFHSIHLLLSFF